jgi:hypothetical protein
MLRAYILRREAGFDLKRRREEVDARINGDATADNPPIVFGSERDAGVQLDTAPVCNPTPGVSVPPITRPT